VNNNYLSDGNAFENKTLSDKTVRLIAKGSITPAALQAKFLDSRITKLELNEILIHGNNISTIHRN